MRDETNFPDFYYTTHFRGTPIPDTVSAFAIITAYPTTGESWPQGEIDAADRALELELREADTLLGRMTGYAPEGEHEEPGWAAQISLHEACDIGMRYRQTAIYYVQDRVVNLSYCDARRGLFEIAPFAERFNAEAE